MPADAATWSGSGACPCPLATDFQKSDHDRLTRMEERLGVLERAVPLRHAEIASIEGKLDGLRMGAVRWSVLSSILTILAAAVVAAVLRSWAVP